MEFKKFSRRAEWPATPNPLAQALDKKRSAGETVFDLTLSNPTKAGFRYLKKSLLKPLAAEENLSYDPDPQGLSSARAAVCGYYQDKGIIVEPHQVFLTAGTSEAYDFIFRLLADPGESILVPAPSYPLIDYLLPLAGAVKKQYRIVYGTDGWHADPDSLTESMKAEPAPKAVLVVNPNNPTGNYLSAEDRELLNRLAAEAGAALISDEVFLDFSNEKGKAGESLAGNTKALTFTLSGISKILGLPQMKLSWVVVSGPEKDRNEAIRRLEVIADTYLSVSAPVQRALSSWLPERGRPVSEILKRVSDNRRFLKKTFSSEKTRLMRAEGGWYAVLSFNSPLTDEQFATQLLEKENVYAHPGYFFDFDHEDYLVLSLLPPPEIFREGVQRLAKMLPN